MTTEEYFDKWPATKRLKEGLKTNIDAVCGDMDQETKEVLLRVNLIICKQCLEDCGMSSHEDPRK